MAERQHGSPEPDRDDEHHEQDRDRQQDIDDAHQRRIDESADQPGNRTVERAHDNRDDRGQERVCVNFVGSQDHLWVGAVQAVRV
jgi:hypothetical protein